VQVVKVCRCAIMQHSYNYRKRVSDGENGLALWFRPWIRIVGRLAKEEAIRRLEDGRRYFGHVPLD